jgi:hypothetical protein
MKEKIRLIEKKQGYETQGEWLDRMTTNAGRLLCLLGLVLAFAGAVVHIATGMWLNILLDAVVIVLTVFGIAYREE